MNQPFLPVTTNFIHGKNYQWTPANWNTSVPMLDRSVNITGKFDLASDLLEDPRGTFHRFTINVTLQLEKRNSTGSEPLVRFPHKDPRNVYHRLGKVQIPEQHYGNDTQGPLITASGKELRKSAEIGYIWALLAWRDGPQGGWQLKRVRAYDFDLYCIGDADQASEWNTVPFKTSYEYTGSFDRVRQDRESFRQLQRRLEKRIEEGWEEPDSGVPFLPKYSFNHFQPSLDSLAAWPKYGIPVAVRCVNWLTSERSTKDIRFPPDLQLTIDEKDTIEDIRKIILQEINRKRTESGVKVNSAALFKPPLAETWELELWVMPQSPDNPDFQGKLHRYTSGRLLTFLSTSPTQRKKDKRLYMEAHVVSKLETLRRPAFSLCDPYRKDIKNHPVSASRGTGVAHEKSDQMSREVRLFDDVNQEHPLEGPREPSSPDLSVEDGAASPSEAFGGEKGVGRSKGPGPQKQLGKEDEREEEQAPQIPKPQGHCMIRRCGWDWSLIVFLDEFEDIQDLIDKLTKQLDLDVVDGQDQSLFYHDHGPGKCIEMRQFSEASLERLRDASIDVHFVRSRTAVARCPEAMQSAVTPPSTVDR
ncbi:hypothetical protein KC335_g3238 [Hortaea werneckii]|nr:hypothetical protein KC337_g8424 [Hortaea werneckii]KAI7273558.1 hypothetical protein KC335_g3238 [Hortaea werneckii]